MIQKTYSLNIHTYSYIHIYIFKSLWLDFLKKIILLFSKVALSALNDKKRVFKRRIDLNAVLYFKLYSSKKKVPWCAVIIFNNIIALLQIIVAMGELFFIFLLPLENHSHQNIVRRHDRRQTGCSNYFSPRGLSEEVEVYWLVTAGSPHHWTSPDRTTLMSDTLSEHQNGGIFIATLSIDYQKKNTVALKM